MTRSVVLLTNPAAGRGRSGRAASAAASRLVAGGYAVEVVQGRDAAETRDLAAAAVAREVDAVVACGGDGVVHQAVQALAGTDVPLGLVPAGSGNDLARALGLPRRDPVGAAEVVLGGHVRRIDLGRAGGRYFACVLSAGFDAVVSELAAAMTWPPGQLRYTRATFSTLRRFVPAAYGLRVDGRPSTVTAMMVAVANTASFGGGLRIAEGAALDDGRLDLVVIHRMTKAALVRTYPRLYRGTHVTHPAFERRLVRTVEVAAPSITAYADGERVGPLPLTVTCAPGALRVLVSPR